MFYPAGRRTDVIDEAMQLLQTLKLADAARHRVSELPYGRQRLVELAIAIGLKPEVLLLDEPAAGVPSAESHIILDAIERLPEHIAVLIIEHDMDVVFRFAKRVTVMVGGAVFAEGTPREIEANPQVRAVYLGQAGQGAGPGRIMASALQLRGVSAGYGETVVIEDIDLKLAPGECISVIGRNGVGKTTLLATVMGHTTLHSGEVMLDGRSLNAVPSFRRALAGIGFVPQEREIFPSLSVRENLDVAARPGHWTPPRVFELFPRLAGTARQHGQSAFRRRAADAVDRARAADQSHDPADGRADRRLGAGPGRGLDRRAGAAARATAGCRSSWSSRTAASR